MSQRAGDDPLANPTLVQATKKRPVERPIVAYPGFHVLDQQEHWDEATRQVIMTRINQVPAFRVFKPHEIQTLQALAARVLPQDDRPAEKRIPIAPWIDQRCYLRLLDGWRFDDMPPDDEAWRLGLLGIDEVAIASYGQQFILLRPDEQDHVLRTIAGGQPPGEVWRNLPPRRFWIYIDLLCPSDGLGRDRLRRPSLSSGLLCSESRLPGTLGSARGTTG
jgi:hypothetical protein